MEKQKSRYKNLKDEKFGRLFVLERDFEKTTPQNKWKVYWKCKCDCGNIISVRAEHLKRDGKQHHTQSCGCLQKEKARINGKLNKLPIGEHSRRCLFFDYKKRAEKKRLTFSLTRDTFDHMITQTCFYCGASPSNKHVNGKNSADYLNYNGIDRKDSTKGYDIDNVVTCCSQCNYAKLDFSFVEFVQWIEKTYNHLKEMGLCKI